MRINNQNQPLVSIILTYYNGQKYVEEAVKSIYAQTYKNIEIIVVDDCSPDLEAREYIKNLAEVYKFKLLVNKENMGASRAAVKGVIEAKGDYISLLAQDDLYLPERIEYLLRLLQKDNLDIVFCNGAYFHDNQTEKYRVFDDCEVIAAQRKGQRSVEHLLSSRDTIGCLLVQGALMTRQFFTETISLRNKFLIDDWPLTIIAWRDYKVKYDSKLVYLYRLHADNVHKNYWKWLPGRFQVISELIPQEQRWNTAANIFADVGNALLSNGDKVQGYRILQASLLFAQDDVTISAIKRFLMQAQKHLNVEEERYCRSALGEVMKQVSLRQKIKYRIVKLMVNLVPIKKWRRRIKNKFL